MQLVSNALAQECAMGAVMVGYFMYYWETWVLPAMMRQEKMQHSWSAAHKRYHENVWRLNGALDRDLRATAVSRALLLDSLQHTAPRSPADHAVRMINANRKVYDALNPASKRVMIWQTSPMLQ